MFKKFTGKRFIVLSMVFLMFFTRSAYAAPSKPKMNVNVRLNGKMLKEKGFIRNGRTYLPVRAIFEKEKADVKWDKNKGAIVITIGKDKIVLNTKDYESFYNGIPMDLNESFGELDAVRIINKRSYIPLRSISYIMDYDISWDTKTRTVDIRKNPENKTGFKQAYKTMNSLVDEDIRLVYAAFNHYGASNKKLSEDYFVYRVELLFDGEVDGESDNSFAVSKKNGKAYIFEPSGHGGVNVRLFDGYMD